MKKLVISIVVLSIFGGFFSFSQIVTPPALEFDFDANGFPVRISMLNQELGVRETMWFAWGDNFVTTTFHTQDGILLVSTYERLFEKYEDGETKIVDYVSIIKGDHVLEALMKVEIAEYASEVKIDTTLDDYSLKAEWKNDVLEDEEETWENANLLFTAVNQTGMKSAFKRMATFYYNSAINIENFPIEAISALQCFTQMEVATTGVADNFRDWQDCVLECVQEEVSGREAAEAAISCLAGIGSANLWGLLGGCGLSARVVAFVIGCEIGCLP